MRAVPRLSKTVKGSPVGASVIMWLQRFAAFDAQEEEVIDQSSAYRALLREQTHDQAGPDGAPATQLTERRGRERRSR